MGQRGSDLQELQKQLQQVRAVKRTMGQGLGGGQNPGGARPETKGDEIKSFDTKTATDFDAKGQKQVTGYAPGRNFKKKSSVEIAEDVKQASQEAPEAIDRQRIPKAASDMAKGYFENLGGQKK